MSDSPSKSGAPHFLTPQTFHDVVRPQERKQSCKEPQSRHVRHPDFREVRRRRLEVHLRTGDTYYLTPKQLGLPLGSDGGGGALTHSGAAPCLTGEAGHACTGESP